MSEYMMCVPRPDRKQHKKIIRPLSAAMLFVAVMLLFAGCGGNGGEKETEALAETKAQLIGNVYIAPVADGTNYLAPAGTDTFSLYLERENVEPGTGVFTLYDAGDDSLLAEIPADSQQVTFAPVSEEHKVYYGMDRGTEVQIRLGFGLEAGKRYYAAVSEEFVHCDDVGNRALGGEGQWPVQVEE